MTRRSFLLTPALAAPFAHAAPTGKMAVASTCYLTVRRPKDTLEFLDHCHSLGAAGMQMGVASTEPEYLKKLRSRVEQLASHSFSALRSKMSRAFETASEIRAHVTRSCPSMKSEAGTSVPSCGSDGSTVRSTGLAARPSAW